MGSCTQSAEEATGEEVGEKLFKVLKGDATQLLFKNTIPENERMNSMTYEYYYNGGGVSIGDVNMDGLPDVYLTGNITPNKLYKNLGGMRFEDITDVSGLKDTPSWTTGSTMVDFNEDGIMDIYVCRSGKLEESQRANQFFISVGLKDGHPVYVEKAEELGLNDAGYSTQAIFLDFDKDNDLDAFVLNHNVNVQPYYDVAGIKAKRHSWVGDRLYENVDGRFQDISERAGILGNEMGYGLGVSAGDVNNDGWPDLYIANDYSEHDYLYLNNQDGTFQEASSQAFGHVSNYSMGTDMADFNNDGLLDIVALDMVAEDNYGIKTSMSGMDPGLFNRHVENGLQHQYMFNSLQLNRGNGQFSEVAQMAGISNTDWSWAPLFLDIDGDGWQDLFVTNGLKRDFRNNDFRKYKIKRLESAEKNPSTDKKRLIRELVAMTPTRKKANYVFKNNGDLTFTKKTQEWGIDIPTYSNGLAYADLDNDGDLDLIANNVNDHPFIYRNESAGNFLKVTLAGPKGNVDGIGAKVKLKNEAGIQVREHYLTRGYQSSSSKGLVFGLGADKNTAEIQVVWPDGKTQTIRNIGEKRELKLEYRNATSSILSEPQGFFRKNNDLAPGMNIDFVHKENPFDDYKREGLLPHRMSQLGPGMAVADVNGDGLEDFYIGGAAGQSGCLYTQSKNGGFIPLSTETWWLDKAYEDVGALFFDADNDGDMDLYVVSGGNEAEMISGAYQDRLYLNRSGQFEKSNALPVMNQSGSRVRSADFDLDGDQDLFVGGRQIPGKYPYPADSYILRNDGGQFVDVTNELAPGLKKLGMVTDAVWCDYNNDGDIDLVVVGEWMPVTLFKNENGQFKREGQIQGLEHLTGWWASIVAEDFDKDGDLDFVVGNNGLNYKYKATTEETFNVYADDFDNSGSIDIVLGYYNEGTLYPLRGRQCSSQQMPFIEQKFPSYKEFARASLLDVYGKQNIAKALEYKAHTFASIYLENHGGKHFEPTPLPQMAQISCINQMLVDDLNGDGHADVVLAGNNFSTEVETPRNDAGIGLVLLGNGRGSFETLDTHTTGLYLARDVKDMAFIGLGGKKKALLVANNNDKVELFDLNFDEEE
ncbi:MAG: VCBS repeat-containing protein [Cyclobacteriaceae bacterium]